MTTVYLSPIGNAWQFFGSDGLPLNAGKLYTYAAGGTTPQATYTTSAGSVQNANPIILNADGRLPDEVWLTSSAYRFDLKDSLDNLLGSYDNINGIYNVSVPFALNSQSAAYTTVLSDAGTTILHPTADNNPRTFTIDSNANVAYLVGTMITFANQINTITIAITSDTLVLAGSGATGSRTLAANGIATAVKIATTTWMIAGTNLT